MKSNLVKILLELFELITRLEIGQEEYDNAEFKRQLIQDLKGTKWFFEQSSEETQSVFENNFKFEDLCLQFIIYLHLSLSMIIHENFFQKKSFKQIKSGSFSFQSIISLSSTLSNLINSLLSIRLMLKNGFDNQANQLIRSYIEYADIAIASLSSKEFFENYKSMVDSSKKEKEVWWNYVRHKSITKILKKSLYDIYPDEEHWEILFKIRKPMFKNSSDHIHGHSGVNLFGIYQTPINEESSSKFALGGFPSKEMKRTYTNIIIYSHQFMSNISACFVHFHDLPFMKFGEEGKIFVRNLKISEHFQKLIIKMNEKEYAT